MTSCEMYNHYFTSPVSSVQLSNLANDLIKANELWCRLKFLMAGSLGSGLISEHHWKCEHDNGLEKKQWNATHMQLAQDWNPGNKHQYQVCDWLPLESWYLMNPEQQYFDKRSKV
jgi:hypothetical protein